MPEGDTVWRTARQLDRALSGATLLASDFRVPALATTDLAGRRVVETVSRGKHLLTRVGDDPEAIDDEGAAVGHGREADRDMAALTVHTHLKMEGAWHLYRPGSRWQRPVHEARLVLRTTDWAAVGFALGVVELVATADEDSVVGHLGPDLLGPDWDADEAVRRLSRAPARGVADALLDQRNLAGIGAIYQAELCFVVGVDPWTPIGDVADLHRLVARARAMLEANKERPRQTTTGDTRRGREFWVYGRGNQPCRRCGALIRQEPSSVGEGRRTTYWCPRCQRRP